MEIHEFKALHFKIFCPIINQYIVRSLKTICTLDEFLFNQNVLFDIKMIITHSWGILTSSVPILGSI